MRTGISITVMASDCKRLQALVKNRNAAQKHAWRAEIVLPSADGAPRPRSGASRRTSGDQASASSPSALSTERPAHFLKPKKRGPDQWAPVISRATIVSDR